MNRDISAWLAPLLALGLLAFVVVQTLGALDTAGVWRRAAAPQAAPPPDPLLALEPVLRDPTPPEARMPERDPFGLAAPAPAARHGGRRPVQVAAPAVPVLTAIVWDADPRAVVRWKNRDWTIRAGGLFDEFEVGPITREQVTLRRGTEVLVLVRKL